MITMVYCGECKFYRVRAPKKHRCRVNEREVSHFDEVRIDGYDAEARNRFNNCPYFVRRGWFVRNASILIPLFLLMALLMLFGAIKHEKDQEDIRRAAALSEYKELICTATQRRWQPITSIVIPEKHKRRHP